MLRLPRPILGGLLGLAALGLSARSAEADCNVVAAATIDFRAALGSTNRPYASPGDVVEVRVRPAVCDDVSTGFVDLDGDGRRSDDHVVTVLFTPPGGGARNAVVLAESCAGIDLAACDAQLGGGSATCVAVDPGADPVELASSGIDKLQFRFPDTDARLAPDDDDRTLVGPAKIVVSRRGAPLACQLATQRCAALAGDTLSNGVVACVDELFALDGTCRTEAAQLAGIFGHFTALPPPNDLERMITAPGTTEVHLTTDAAGNLIVPMDYTALLIRIGGRPVPLIARANAAFDAFAGGIFEKVDIPVRGFAGSYSPEGIPLPPVFSPLSDRSHETDTILFGSIDAPRGIVRVARQACVEGTREGFPCTIDAECPGAAAGACAGPIMELRDRYHAGVGPVNLLAGQYLAVRETPITLESVSQRQGSGSFAFVVYEGFDAVDRNGDGDETDFVLTLRDRETGVLRPIGADPAIGRAIVQVRDGPFASPALESEGNLVAFLESEPNQGGADASANGDVFDPVLRIFRLDAGEATELTTAASTVEAAPAFGGRVGAWLGSRFFFRSAEPREAAQVTARVSESILGGEPDGSSEVTSFGAFPRGSALSADGRYVVFNSVATDLVASDPPASRDIFVRDRDADGNGIFDEPGGVATEVASVATGGAAADSGSDECVISASGRYVAFGTGATNLDSGGIETCGGSVPGSCFDVVVRDRVAGTTRRVSVDQGGGESNGTSFHPSLSADGRFVAFSSAASDLVAGDTNGLRDVFVRDRCESEGTAVLGCTERTVRVSVASNGADLPGLNEFPAISGDGRSVAFQGFGRVYVHDRDADRDGVLDEPEPGAVTTEVVSLSVTNAIRGGQLPTISGDGRYVAFASNEADLVAGDTNGVFDVFVRDRVAGVTERVSVASDGTQGSGVSAAGFVSEDGRSVAFWSLSPDLVAGDSNVCPGTGECRDIFVHDRLTGATRLASVSTAGIQANDYSNSPSLSADGRFVVFETTASTLVPGDGATQDIFVRGVETSDLAAAELSGDDLIDDTVLRVADASGASASVDDLCPAEAAATAGDYVAFLRPEAAGPSAAPCAEATGDLSGDGDTRDRVIELYHTVSGSVANLRCPASEVALSTTRLAALVSADWDGAGDPADAVLALRAPTDAAPATCAAWGPTALPGVALDVSGDTVALLTDEADLGPLETSLNGDADQLDRVLRLVDGSDGSLIPLLDDAAGPAVPQAAEDFVLGTTFVAFRTRESAQAAGPACSLNVGDTDCLDDVLQIYLLPTVTQPNGTFLSTGQAVVPCTLPECDPRKPYRVSQDTVRFLTYEADQGQDLNQDDDQDDLLVQVFNVQSRQAKVVAEVADPGQAGQAPVPGAGADPLASPSEESSAAQSSQVAVAQGRCVEDREAACSPTASACARGEFCFAEEGQTTGSCVRDTGATCYADRPPGEQGCLVGAVCVRDYVVLAIADRDADQVPDAIDDCPDAANTDQADADQDGVGDLCDLQTCGDGTLQLDEQCDDGNLADDDDCDSNCRVPACGNGIVNVGALFDEACDDGNLLAGDGCSPGCEVEECSNGLDDDGDGAGDAGADLGCTGLDDLSERQSGQLCDDGIDNDFDGLTDYPADPGCGFPWYTRENPACDDGLDNDEDGTFDWDGAGQGGADLICNRAWGGSEASCGLGGELVVAVALLQRLRRRR